MKNAFFNVVSIFVSSYLIRQSDRNYSKDNDGRRASSFSLGMLLSLAYESPNI